MIKKHKPGLKPRYKEESSKYVLLNNPTTLRKNILSSALDSVRILKNFEEFKNIKVKKHDLITNLNKTMDEINSLFLSLHKKLPLDESIKEEIKKSRIEVIKPQKSGYKAIISEKIESSEEDKILSELRSVENRLRKINL